MQLVEMTTMQLNQLNIPNPEPVKELTNAAWRSSDGQYAVLIMEFNAFTEDGGRRIDRHVRFLRVYAADDRGIHMPLYTELVCDEGVDAFILVDIGQLLDDQPGRVELTRRLRELRTEASQLDPVTDSYYITMQSYAQYKTKGNHDAGEDQGQQGSN